MDNAAYPHTRDGRASVSSAASGGHEGMVGRLSGREDINPNVTDTEHDRTPLVWASDKVLEGVIRLLVVELEDAGPHIADTECGRTPPGWAEGTIKLLLEREDSNPNTEEMEDGLTPLG